MQGVDEKQENEFKRRFPEQHRRLAIYKIMLDAYVFSHIKVFDESTPEDHDDNYYMEREWRILGGIQFELPDVRRIVIPASYAKRFREGVPEYYGQVTLLDT